MPQLSRFILIFCSLFLCCAFFASPLRAASESSLRADIRKEEEKAKAREGSLKRLTEQEKALNKDLAELEKRILALEKDLAGYRKNLSGLATAGESAQKEYDRILAEQKRTEAAMREMLFTFWGLYTRRASIGGRDLENWPALDREYHWTADLMRAIELYRERLKEQEAELAEVIGQRDSIGREITSQMAAVDRDKAQLLADRIKYEQRLAGLRKERQGAEADLADTLKLIQDLNFDLQNLRQAAVAIDKAKGSLPWPVQGKVAQKYSPSANPPVRGLGFSAKAGADVRAVHSGKVMFRDTMRGLGLVVVVQHGQEYFSVYAFLSESPVSLGQNVNRGQAIGKCGYYPAIKGEGLYFELRHHQTALNPTIWLAKS